ncbi:holin [Pontibacillus salicampi]|uniref:Holin n=1 Tax=Pontibacillus salicampi TaxID=1449801 RepID=A0ABV6LTW4_9BACI
MQQVLIFASVIAPFVTGLLQAVKRVTVLPKNYMPLIAVVMGVALGTVAYPFTDMGLALRLWSGAGAGLSATGLFELVQKKDGYTNKGKGGE